MTKEELITKQALEIEELKSKIASYENSVAEIKLMLICIGGPLNDNKHHYSNDQLKIFFRIQNSIRSII